MVFNREFVPAKAGRKVEMNDQRHKREESFSVFLVSNLGRSSRQFHITLFSIRLAAFVLFLICAAVGFLIYLCVSARGTQNKLRAQLAEQEQLICDMEEQWNALNSEKMALTAENEALRQNATDAPAAQSVQETSAETAAAFPSRYPSYGAGVLQSNYSEEEPYLSINTYTGGNIIAAGSGIVMRIASDDTYPHIVELEHGNGYVTRYLCRQEAELRVVEGARVQAGDILLTITKDDTQLDYQILYEEKSVDPLEIIDAKG